MMPLPNVEAERVSGVPDLVSLVEMPEWKAILLDLVKSEKMDPWDIDLVFLAQKYLERIRSMRENNLYVPANALLACAILLNMKADVLRQYFVEEEEQQEDLVMDFAFLEEPEPIPEPVDAVSDHAPGELPSVLPPARITARRVTLDELLSAMERVMKAKKKAARRPEVNVDPLEDFFEDMEQEDVDVLIQETYERVLRTLDSEGITTLSRIVDGKDPLSIVRRFLPVLYLANEGKVNVWQEKPFEEIFISVVENEEPAGAQEDH